MNSSQPFLSSGFRVDPRSILLAACLLLWISMDLPASEVPDANSLLTVDRIFGKEKFKTQEWGPARWLDDGSGFTTLETSETVEDGKDIVRYDPESGQREVLVSVGE